MNKSFVVKEIQRILCVEDKFNRIDLNKYEIESIEHLLGPFLNDCQNNSPELVDMIKLCKDYSAILECYITESSRSDARLSCEGIVFPKLSSLELVNLANDYHIADEFHISVNNDGTFRLRLWWD